MKKPDNCAIVCKKTFKQRDIDMMKDIIDNEYRIHWSLDNLPVVVKNETNPDGFSVKGFAVGNKFNKSYYIYNHIRIFVKYNQNDNDAPNHIVSEPPSKQQKEKSGYNIIGFEVIPMSIKV